MHHDADPSERPTPKRRGRKRALLAATLLAVGVLAAACGGGGSSNGVASAGSSTTAHGSSKSSTKASGLAYSQCMRSHGITDFPDPNSQGHIDLTQGSGINISSPQFQSAQSACKSLQPGAGTPAQQAQQTAAALNYAKCMRAHGVPNFPDPNSQGGFQIEPGSGMNPNSSQYQAADKTCHHFLANEPGGGQTMTKGAP